MDSTMKITNNNSLFTAVSEEQSAIISGGETKAVDNNSGARLKGDGKTLLQTIAGFTILIDLGNPGNIVFTDSLPYTPS